MENAEIKRLSRLVQTCQEFWNNGHALLGEVFAASGYRTRKATAHGGNIRIDWALIGVSFDQMKTNAVSNHSKLTCKCIYMKGN